MNKSINLFELVLDLLQLLDREDELLVDGLGVVFLFAFL